MTKPERVDDLQERLAKYEERLRNNEARIRSLIETIPLGLLIVNQTGKIESASPACLALFQCGYADLHQRDLAQIFGLPPEEANALLVPSTLPIELLAMRRDGTRFPAAIRISSFAPSPTSDTPSLLLVIEDVSTKHELEQLRQEFVSMLTHDLRTPITSIKCFLQLVGEGVFEGRADKLKDRCDGAEIEADRLLSMINSVLDLHKLEAGKLQLVVESTSLDSLIAQSVESVASWAASSGVQVTAPAVPETLTVSCDRDHTVRVLVNLLSNAVKFSPKGQSVSVAVELDTEFVKVLVIDRGPGIPEDFRNRLFNRFEQARLSDARVKGGTGLGLAIAKAIVEEQGGKIGVDSEVGHGASFWFTLRRG